MSGDTSRAQQAFSDFMATDYGRTPVGRVFVTDYLLESKQWAKVLEFTAPLFPMFEQGDTICDDFHSLLITRVRDNTRPNGWSANGHRLSGDPTGRLIV